MSAGDLATGNVLAREPSVGVPSQEPGEVDREADRQEWTGAELRSGQSARANDQINKRERITVLRRLYLGSMLHKCRQFAA